MGISRRRVADPSMFKFATLYNKLKDQTSNGSEIAMIVMALVAAIAITAIIALIFACVSKGIPALVFSIIGFLLFLVLNWDFSDRGVVPTGELQLGIWLLPPVSMQPLLRWQSCKAQSLDDWCVQAQGTVIP